MADKKVYNGTFEDIIKMTKEKFEAHLIEYGNVEAFKQKVLSKKYPRKQHQRIQKPMKYDSKNPDNYNPEKMTWQKDNTRPTTTVMEKPTFMKAKAEYCYVVLGMPRPEKKEKKSTWYDDFMNM